MNPEITIQELSILVTSPNHNPTLLTPDFLAGSGIVPKDWQLARPPLLKPQLSQVAFTNGINLVAQPGSVTFTESIKKQDEEPKENTQELKVAAIASQYIQTLPNLDYRAVAINPRSFLTFGSENEFAARDYIVKHFLTPAPWLEVGTDSPRASLNLAYTFEETKLNLAIAEVKLQQEDKPATPAILFSGNFPYKITETSNGQKQSQLFTFLANWKRDLALFGQTMDKFIQPDT
ncbi:MAG: hypothetical protein WA999_04240 [Spirulinaceae cyanobacterium]